MFYINKFQRIEEIFFEILNFACHKIQINSNIYSQSVSKLAIFLYCPCLIAILPFYFLLFEHLACLFFDIIQQFIYLN